MTFQQWMRKVDGEIAKRCGLSSGDLADQCYRDMYEDGLTPAEAADEVLEEERFLF